jgi:hypothetical protein
MFTLVQSKDDQNEGWRTGQMVVGQYSSNLRRLGARSNGHLRI